MIPVLAAAFLFNLGQGVLRPTLPLYLATVFTANYRMVTAIPSVFGAGKWMASLPTGYLLDRVGRRPLMVAGLGLMALVDLASASTTVFGLFLTLRALGGVGWAMFGTVATTTTVDRRDRRGGALSALLISETCGVLVGNAVGGWLYEVAGIATPFLFEAGCMVLAGIIVALWLQPPAAAERIADRTAVRMELRAVLRVPAVVAMSVISGVLIAIQTGVLVFLVPLFLATRAGLTPERVGVLVSLTVLGRLPALWLGGVLSDRWDRVRILIPGLLLFAVFLGTFASLRHPVALAFWSFALGGASGLIMPLPTAVVADSVPPELRGVAIGWLRTVTDVGHVLGPLMLGWLADAVDLAAPFIVAAGLLTAVALWRSPSSAAQRG